MKWDLLDSKMLAASAYAPESRTLYLRFHSGDVYRYFEVPPAEYESFLTAESKGRYFLSHIRDHFRYERMAKLRTV
jgi:hypothetical protein